jgi:hypothetical protein
VILQDISRRALSAGFVREQDDERGAEHRNKEYRHGAMLSNNTVWCGNRLPCQQFGPRQPFLRMLWRVLNTIRQLLQYGRPPGSLPGPPVIQNIKFGSHGNPGS